jgi:hypothetical protein
VLVRSIDKHDTIPSSPGLASTRPAASVHPWKRLPSRK